MENKVIKYDKRSEEISLKQLIIRINEWFRYLLSKWIFIISFGIFGGGVGLGYSLISKPVYIAATNFVLEDSDKMGGLGQYGALASMAGVDIGGSGGGIFQGDNILELYKSRNMIEKTLLTEVVYNGKKQLLIDCFIEINNLRTRWSKKPELRDIQFKSPKMDASMPEFTRLQDSILGTIVNEINKSYLKVSKPDKKLSIIRAEVKFKDEWFAKNFDEQIVKNVNDFYIQTKTKKSLETIAILQQKVDSVRSVLNGAIYNAASVVDATPNLNITRQVQRVVPMQRSQFTAETNKGMLSELMKNLELSKISLLKETPLIQIIDQPVFPLEKQQLGKLKGIIIGAFFAGFLTVLFLLFKEILKMVMS